MEMEGSTRKLGGCCGVYSGLGFGCGFGGFRAYLRLVYLGLISGWFGWVMRSGLAWGGFRVYLGLL